MTFASEKNIGRTKVRLSAESEAYFNEPHLGKEHERRLLSKSVYKFLAMRILRQDGEAQDGPMRYDTARNLLQKYRNFPKYKSVATQNRWLARALKALTDGPSVTKFPRYIIFDSLIDDCGGMAAVEERRRLVEKTGRQKNAACADRYRNPHQYCLLEPVRANVMINSYPPCTKNDPPLYNASQPRPQPISTPSVASPMARRSSVVAARQSVAAPPAKQGFAPVPQPPSATPQILAPPAKLPSSHAQLPEMAIKDRQRVRRRQGIIDAAQRRKSSNRPSPGQPSRSDNAKGAHPVRSDEMTQWLAKMQPPKDPPKGNFDPRTNPAARPMRTDGDLSLAMLLSIKRMAPKLAGLSYGNLKRRGCTDDILAAAYHLYSNKDDKGFDNPCGMLLWHEKALRTHTYRFAQSGRRNEWY